MRSPGPGRRHYILIDPIVPGLGGKMRKFIIQREHEAFIMPDGIHLTIQGNYETAGIVARGLEI